jgi:O-succinylbenzoic acid--CoA ligase
LLPPEPGGGRLLDLLSAALDGTGPAILPLDPALPPARLAELLAIFAPGAIVTPDGTQRIAAPPGPGGGVRPDVAVIVATSGSTGVPKGVALSAAALRASAAASLARIGARPGGRWLCCLPGFHVAGLQVLIRSLLGGTVPVVAGRVDAGVIARSGCAYVSLVPTQLRRLLDDGAPLDAFGAILLGGAAPAPGLLADARAAGARVITTYGMSETCGGCVYDGVPLDGVRVRISDAGLIGLAGPVLFSGYWPASASRAAPGDHVAPGDRGAAGDHAVPGDRGAGDRAAPGDHGAPGDHAAPGDRDGAGDPAGPGGPAPGDGWFWTSDLGALDGAGRLTVRGRADDVINSGGEKVVPGEVESVLGTLGGVRDVVIVGVPDSEWGEIVTAVIVPEDPAAPPELARLRAQARERIPGYAAPRRLILVAEIPMLASGKPDRQALRAAAQAAGRDARA